MMSIEDHKDGVVINVTFLSDYDYHNQQWFVAVTKIVNACQNWKSVEKSKVNY